MRPFEVTRRHQWCMGHRLMGHEGFCAMCHGHNYIALFWARRSPALEELDDVGRVVDFAELKRVGSWIEHNWDHGFVLHRDDTHARALMDEAAEVLEHGQKTFLLPYNPTAENLAAYLLTEACPNVLAGTGAQVFRVDLWETENCRARAEL